MHNLYHLGDNIYSLIFINNLIDNNNINFEYSCRYQYLKELEYHNYKNIKMSTTRNINSVDTWIQANNVWSEYCSNQKDNNEYYYYDEFYLHFYDDLANRNNLTHTFNKIDDTLYYHPDLEIRRYSDYDFFIINSPGASGQFSYIPNDFVELVNKLKCMGFSVITTEKIKGFESTRERGMTLKDIGNLSIGCKNIISVHTSPMATALNKMSVNTVDKWILLNDKNISYKNVDMKIYDDVKKIEIDGV